MAGSNGLMRGSDPAGDIKTLRVDADGKLLVGGTGTVGLTNTELRAEPVPVGVAVEPISGSVSAIVTDQILLDVVITEVVRFLKFHLHMDPAASAGVYNTVTIKVGTLTVFRDKFEPGLPYMESILLDTAARQPGGDVTITTDSGTTIFYNLRAEVITP